MVIKYEFARQNYDVIAITVRSVRAMHLLEDIEVIPSCLANIYMHMAEPFKHCLAHLFTPTQRGCGK